MADNPSLTQGLTRRMPHKHQEPQDTVRPSCYICRDLKAVDHGNGGDALELVAPCVCRSHVHRGCLDAWRRCSLSKTALSHCPTCKTAFELDPTPSIPWQLDRVGQLGAAAVMRVATYLWAWTVLAAMCLFGPFVGPMSVAAAALELSKWVMGRLGKLNSLDDAGGLPNALPR
ncbi:hypothetical protein As57867_001423, partial [Aphanomyces stellatus]